MAERTDALQFELLIITGFACAREEKQFVDNNSAQIELV